MTPKSPRAQSQPVGERLLEQRRQYQEWLAKLDADGLDRTWTMRMGERVLVQNTKRLLMRVMVLSHMVHHRAQLGVYYRLLNVPVPGVYGPTADEPL